ncbi:MAG: patatin-like phospholipase family protein [Planctomycetota bacterium]|nr:patatin-like phospholipase family protein [Planctomycetota bacterium]
MKRSRWMALGAIVLALLVAGCGSTRTAKHPFDPDYQEPRVDFSRYESVQGRVGQDPKRAVALAISGGGQRAANFAASVMCELEEFSRNNVKINLLAEVDYICTVSGGGLAAAAYISKLRDFLKAYPDDPSSKFTFRAALEESIGDKPSIMRNLEKGYHHVLVGSIFDPRTWGMLDRGDFLERAFDDKFLGNEVRKEPSLTLREVFVPKDAGRKPALPYWIPTSANYQNGAIFPHTPDMYERYGIIEYVHRLRSISLGENPDYFSIPLAVGLKASASFPGAVPATTLESSWQKKKGYRRSNRFIHLGDGGMADNLGVVTALRALRHHEEDDRVLIIIDAYNGETEPFSRRKGSPMAVEVGVRNLTIGLDSRRIRLKDIVGPDPVKDSEGRVLMGTTHDGIKVIFMSFDLLDNSLRHKARRVPTSFDITGDEQTTLFDAGKQVVGTQGEQLYRVFGGL